MADYEVPVNKVGVVKAILLDLSGVETSDQMSAIYWSVTGGGSAYFELTVAADGLSAEIHPIAEGSGSIRIEASSVGNPSVIQTRTVEIVGSDTGVPASGNYPRFIGTEMNIVSGVGSLA